MAAERWTVRRRVTVSATSVLVLAFALTALAAAGLLRRSLINDEDAALVERTDQIETLIDQNSLPDELDATGSLARRVQVIDVDGRIVSATAGLPGSTRLGALGIPSVGHQEFFTTAARSVGIDETGDVRILVRSVSAADGSPLTIAVMISVRSAERAESYLRTGLLLGLPVIVVLTSWFVSRVVGRALAPVESMRSEVDRLSATDLSARVGTVGHDEIARLGGTLNRLLGRLEDAQVRQELFAASASHELRSPLAAIRTELEVGRAYPDRTDWDSVAGDCLVEVARLEHLASDLRLVTRSVHAAATIARRFDLAELVADEVAHRQPTHPIRMSVPGGPVPVHADRDGMLRVVRNLLDNADRHAATEVSVVVTSDPDGALLIVANDGEPVPGDQLERIFDPFTRLDEARSLDDGGSGLGLAIARRMMESNGGSLTAVGTDRGAEFRGRLPLVG